MTISRALLNRIIDLIDDRKTSVLDKVIEIRKLCVAELSDPLQLSQSHASTHPRDPGAPSHWCRCNYTETDDLTGELKRCMLGDPHGDEPHKFPTPADPVPR